MTETSESVGGIGNQFIEDFSHHVSIHITVHTNVIRHKKTIRKLRFKIADDSANTQRSKEWTDIP